MKIAYAAFVLAMSLLVTLPATTDEKSPGQETGKQVTEGL
jgi:hypothetical protein